VTLADFPADKRFSLPHLISVSIPPQMMMNKEPESFHPDLRIRPSASFYLAIFD
jgi:hypothetical protein